MLTRAAPRNQELTAGGGGADVLGSRVQAGETSSARARNNLWSVGQSAEVARRSAGGWLRNGGLSSRARHSVASGGRSGWEDTVAGADGGVAEEVAGSGGSESSRGFDGLQAVWVGTSESKAQGGGYEEPASGAEQVGWIGDFVRGVLHGERGTRAVRKERDGCLARDRSTRDQPDFVSFEL